MEAVVESPKQVEQSQTESLRLRIAKGLYAVASELTPVPLSAYNHFCHSLLQLG